MHSYAPIDADDVSVPADAPADVYAVLSARERRAVLRRLAATDRPVAVADLARDVARELGPADPDDPSRDAGPSAERLRELRIRLHHCDLPKLVDHDLAAIDRERGTVTLQERGERIAEYLDVDGQQTGAPGSTA